MTNRTSRLNIWKFVKGFVPLVLLSGFVAFCVHYYSTLPSVIIKRFSLLSYEVKNTWTPNTWLGIRALQNPNDAWIIQEIIAEIRPDYIVETGTSAGGSAVLWAMILREVNPDGKVISIDIDSSRNRAKDLPIARDMITFMVGSSTDGQIVSEVVARVEGKKTLIILDSNHSRDHVLAELQHYSPLVSVGSYIIVQDSNVNGHPAFPEHGPGPMEAIEEFLPANEQFAVDRQRERMLFTLHPNGYLKRLK